jgi:polar amino acid transport system substrate-binding protein
MIRWLALIVALAGPARAQDLQIGTEPDYAPYVFLDGQGELIGFDIDLGNAICAELALTCTWVAMPFDQLVDTVARGEVDLAIAGMAATPGRAERVDFTRPYRDNTVASFGAFAALQPGLSAEGALTAVQSGTIYIDELDALGQPYREYESMTAMLDALRRGEVQVIFGGYGNIEDIIETTEPQLRIIEGVEMTNYGTAIAVHRGNKGLTQRINAALDALEARGVLDELEARWFPVGQVL